MSNNNRLGKDTSKIIEKIINYIENKFFPKLQPVKIKKNDKRK